MKPLFISLLLCFLVSNLQAQIITTVAGNGQPGFFGDGGIATVANLRKPTGATVDSVGNIYIADFGNTRVRKVSAEGIITTIAGNGAHGFSGDGGPATSASLGSLEAVKIDAHGNIFTVESSIGRVRKIDKNGIITTVAGGGSGGLGEGGLAVNAQLYSPANMNFDKNGVMYIVDGSRIRKVDANGIITTVAGNGQSGHTGDGGLAINASIGTPIAVAVNSSGEFFIVDPLDHRVRKVDKNGIITTFAGTGQRGYTGDGGKALNATIHSPYDVAIDLNGNLYIAEAGNNVIRKVATDSIITTVAGNGQAGYSGDGGPATAAMLSGVESVIFDRKGNMYMAEYTNNIIRKVTGAALPLTLLSFTGGLRNSNALLQWQTAMEENTSHFDILRSSDGISFVNAGAVTAAGNTASQTSYTFNDVNISSLHANTLFYKLYCVDKDGTGVYSKTIQLNLSPVISFLAWPNPAKNVLYVNVNGGSNSVQLSMSDAAGRVISVLNVPPNSTAASFNTTGLKAGIYFVSTVIEGKKYQQKFIKE